MCIADTAEELTGELGVVAVLAEREVRMRSATGVTASQAVLDIGSGRFRRLGLDNEAQRIAERLAEEAAGQRVGE